MLEEEENLDVEKGHIFQVRLALLHRCFPLELPDGQIPKVAHFLAIKLGLQKGIITNQLLLIRQFECDLHDL